MDEKDKRIKELEKENARLKKENELIIEEKEKIIKEFEEYKANHHSTVHELRKALKIKPNINRKPKNLGAPKGHKGFSRKTPLIIDSVKKHQLHKCPCCGKHLPGEIQEVRDRYIIDIKFTLRPKTTKHLIPRKYCTGCKKLVEPEINEALPHARFGLNLMLLVLFLKLSMRLSCQKVAELLRIQYGLTICDAEVVNILKQLVNAFGSYYKYLEKMIKQARVKHSDSTGWRIMGKNYFVWVFIACGTVLYKVRKRNNHKVALQVLGKTKKKEERVLVVDRHSAFRTLAEKAGFKLQLCWSHILEDSKGLKKDFGSEGAYVHKKLKTIYANAIETQHYRSEEIQEQLKGEIIQLTQRHYSHKLIWKFVLHLANRDIENLFRFVTDPEIEPTNNISERELRSMVLIRKISFGSRSTRGANATAFLMSILQTARLNEKNPILEMQKILKNTSGY